MIENTFCHLRGIGPAREAALWRAGCRTWRAMVEGHPAVDELLPGGLGRLAKSEIRADIERLELRDAAGLGARFKSAIHWRAFEAFRPKSATLDIETTGTDRRNDLITMIGIYREDSGAALFVDGFNLEGFREALDGVDLLVTFNGASFDVPFLKSRFPNWRPPPLHVDLRWVAHKLGLNGGLKRVERILGVDRGDDLAGLDGWDAVRLWRRWRDRSDRSSLTTLAKYNLADVILLRWVAAGCIDRLLAGFDELNPAPLNKPAAAWGQLRVGELLDLVVEPDGSVVAD